MGTKKIAREFLKNENLYVFTEVSRTHREEICSFCSVSTCS